MELPPQVLLVGNYPPDKQRSMLRFADLMAEGLRNRGLHVEVLAPKAWLGDKTNKPGLKKWLGYLDKFILFPRVLRQRIRAVKARGDSFVVHVCDHSNARYVRYLQRVPHLVTCHDLLAVRSARGEFPGVQPRWSGRRLQADILQNLSRARQIVCDSNATRADVCRLTKLPDERVMTQYISLDQRVWMLEGDNRCLASPKQDHFLLHVGSDAWYKNRVGVLHIYLELNNRMRRVPALVMVGPAPSSELKTLLDGNRDLAARVHFVQDVDDHALAVLYRAADALLFPSLAEGFGWPVLEAQACGCPVVASNRASLAEIGGDAAVYIPPDDPCRAADILVGVLGLETDRRRCLINRGLVNAARFTTDQMINGYLGAYQKVLNREGQAA
jgi:glycosyltransferase involved in cell wall biosynthesis